MDPESITLNTQPYTAINEDKGHAAVFLPHINVHLLINKRKKNEAKRKKWQKSHNKLKTMTEGQEKMLNYSSLLCIMAITYSFEYKHQCTTQTKWLQK